MEKTNKNIIYQVDILDKKEDDVDIELKQVEKEEEPLFNVDKLDQNYLVQSGREVLHLLRDLALGSEKLEPRTDDTYEERDPFSGPIKRTQLPVYPEDTQRYREEAIPKQEELEFETPRILAETVNKVIEHLPDTETIKTEINNTITKLTDWIQEASDSFLASSSSDNKQEDDPKQD